MAQLEHVSIQTNGIQLHVVQAGPDSGPMVILLHGFPEFWYGWQKQLSALGAAGYRVWAPDQRGYNLSEKPPGVAAYTLDTLAADVIGLIDATGRAQVSLVSHDWGGLVAWWVALHAPQRVQKLAVLNMPHPLVMRRTLRRSVAQVWKSWYIFFFQLPWLPEAVMRARNWHFAARALQGTSRRGTFSAANLEQYRLAWSQPGACAAMLHWYRALGRHRPRLPADPRIRIPTLLIWGAQDYNLGIAMAQPSIELCDQGKLVVVEEATHWVQHEEPARVNQLLVDFLALSGTA